jgi:hypothetical protein
MKTAMVTLRSTAPYSQSKHYDVPKLDKELPKDYEARTWQERLHVSPDGHVQIPPMAFKNCLAETAKYLSIQIPGKGKATYTKHFEAGVMITEPLVLPIKKEDVDGEWLFLPSDGKRGGGKRVSKCMPIIHEWAGMIAVHVLDETITQDVLAEHFDQAGKFIGIGRFRPRNNGYYGRFEVAKIEWE